MNLRCFRLIFSKVLGFLIPVAEITTSRGKRSQRTGLQADVAQAPLSSYLLPVVTVLRTLQQSFVDVRGVARASGCALLTAMVFAPGIASALPIADPAGGLNKPGVVAPLNGVPVINIVKPNAAGLSQNKFQKFDVAAPGVVFNNSTVDGRTRLGGATQKNANLSQAAKGILVDVTGANASNLSGTLEVFGQKADLFIANPNGITLNGVNTVNANSLTATTGKPIVSPTGALQFAVTNGGVAVGSGGVDTSGLSYFDIVARLISLQGPVGSAAQATDINAIAGLTTYTAATRHADVTSSSAPGKFAVAIDGSLAGAMYGRNISLLSTETGAGVRHAGLIRGAQDISISAQGDISVASVQAGRNASLNTTGALQVGTGAAGQGLTAAQAVTLNAGKTITISNAVQGDTLSVTANSLLVQAAQLSATSAAPGPVKSINIKVGDFTLSGALVAYNLDGSPVAANQPLVIADGKLQVQRGVGNFDEKFTLKTNAMVISRNGVNLEAGTIANNGGIVQDLGNGGINLLARQLTNKGVINTHGDMKLVTDVLNNLCTGTSQQICAGLMAGGKADLQAGTLTNEAGLVAGTDLNLTLKGQSQNADRAAITAKGQLTIKQAAGNQASLVSSGKVISGGDLLVILNALSSNNNATIHTDGKGTFQISASFSNGGWTEAAQDLNIAAGNFTNGANSSVVADQNLQIVAKDKIDLQRNSYVYSGQVGTFSTGNVLQNAGAVDAVNTLNMHADGQFINDTGSWLAKRVNITGGQLTNNGATFNALEQLNVNVQGNITNDSASYMLSRGNTDIVASGNVLNLNGSVIYSQKKLTVDASSLINAGKNVTGSQSSTLDAGDITLKTRNYVGNEGAGSIKALRTLDVQTGGFIYNSNSSQISGTDVKLAAVNDIDNEDSSTLTGNTVSLTSGKSITNTNTSTIKANTQLSMQAQDIVNSNKATLTAQKLVAQGSRVTNIQSGKIQGGDIVIHAADRYSTDGTSFLQGDQIAIDANRLEGL